MARTADDSRTNLRAGLLGLKVHKVEGEFIDVVIDCREIGTLSRYDGVALAPPS